MEERQARDFRQSTLRDIEHAIAKLYDLIAGMSATRRRRVHVTQCDLRGAIEVHEVICYRRRRSRYLRADLFADPAWDILLELYAAELENRRVSTGRLCLISGVPPSTTRRWMKTLADDGLLELETAGDAGGCITLTRKGRAAMSEYFSDLGSETGAINCLSSS